MNKTERGKLYEVARWGVHNIPGFRPVMNLVVFLLWKVWGSWHLRRAYRRSLRRGENIRLHIGAGETSLPGWFNTDITHAAPLYLDATKPFPIEDSSVQYIFCETVLSGLTFSDIMFFLRESFRVLKSGGVIRISTPDLETHCREYLARSDMAKSLLDRNRRQGYDCGPTLAAIINKVFCGDGAKYVYDQETLEWMLRQVGFTHVVRCRVTKSLNPELCDLEHHHVRSVFYQFMLIVEATKER